MSGLMSILGMLPCGLAALGMAALLTWIPKVNMRTGREYGLCIVSSLLLACTIVLVIFVTIVDHLQKQPLPPHTYRESVLLVFYFIPAIYATAAILLWAAIVAAKAGHWPWIVGFLVSALVPVLLAVPPLPSLLFPQIPVQQIGFLGMLIAPSTTVLAYSITRLRHPVTPLK